MSRVDIIGFGPIGRELARRLASDEDLSKMFVINSVSDNSGCIFPANASEALKAVEWKQGGRKLSGFESSHSTIGEDQRTSSAIVADVTNSDYSRPEEAKKRALSALKGGKHLVSANKVALSSYYSEIFELSRKKELSVGLGATICGARHAISVAQNIPSGEILSAQAVLNASTTLILSMLEEDPGLTFEKACEKAAETGVLESDWSVDLDGIDAAAKTAILANVIYPESRMTLNGVARKGLRDEKTRGLIESARPKKEHVRLVSNITSERSSVEPIIVPRDSPLAVSGRFNAVVFNTKTLGEISVRNLGGGVALTVSVIVSDMKEIAARFKTH